MIYFHHPLTINGRSTERLKMNVVLVAKKQKNGWLTFFHTGSYSFRVYLSHLKFSHVVVKRWIFCKRRCLKTTPCFCSVPPAQLTYKSSREDLTVFLSTRDLFMTWLRKLTPGQRSPNSFYIGSMIQKCICLNQSSCCSPCSVVANLVACIIFDSVQFAPRATLLW